MNRLNIRDGGMPASLNANFSQLQTLCASYLDATPDSADRPVLIIDLNGHNFVDVAPLTQDDALALQE